MRAFCQGTTFETFYEPLTNSRGEIDYCYGEDKSCATDYECSLPGPRHGHASTSFILGGASNVLLLFGGETTDLPVTGNADATLSREVFAGYFSLRGVVFTRFLTQDAWGELCEPGVASDTCPAERRDAAVSVLDNVGSNNGKLLVFGGMTSTGKSSPMWTYLNRFTSSELVSLDDLWYLDLNSLDEDCVKDAICWDTDILVWKKIDVPGQSPTTRWGAGMLLDSANNLYVTVRDHPPICMQLQ